jgi:hypothetical protein
LYNDANWREKSPCRIYLCNALSPALFQTLKGLFMKPQMQLDCCATPTGRERLGIWTIVALVPLLSVVLFSGDVWALQTHGGTEGVVVHQLAHLQYLGALGYLLWDLRRSAFAGVGWLYLQRFCLLMMLWNGIAFIGHFSQMSLGEDAISTEDGYLSALLLLPISFGKWIYYITALDHLLCVPALFFLFLAMRTFYRSLDIDKKGEDV